MGQGEGKERTGKEKGEGKEKAQSEQGVGRERARKTQGKDKGKPRERTGRAKGEDRESPGKGHGKPRDRTGKGPAAGHGAERPLRAPGACRGGQDIPHDGLTWLEGRAATLPCNDCFLLWL